MSISLERIKEFIKDVDEYSVSIPHENLMQIILENEGIDKKTWMIFYTIEQRKEAVEKAVPLIYEVVKEIAEEERKAMDH